MKRFISLAMAVAMAASAVPATAYAKSDYVTATAKIVGGWTKEKGFNGEVSGAEVPELQLKITQADYPLTGDKIPQEKVTVTLGNAEFLEEALLKEGVLVTRDGQVISGEATTSSKKYVFSPIDTDDHGSDIKSDITAIYDDGKLEGSAVNYAGYKLYALDEDHILYGTEGETAVTNAVTLEEYVKAYVEDARKNADITESQALQALWDAIDAAESTEESNMESKLNIIDMANYQYVANFNGSQGEGYMKKAGASGETITFLPMEEVKAALLDASAGNKTQADLDEEMGIFTATAQDDIFEKIKAEGLTLAEEPQITEVELNGDGEESQMPQISVEVEKTDADEMEMTFTGKFQKDDVISVDLLSQMDKTTKNATVSVESDFVNADDLVYVSVEEKGISASIKKTVDVAVEEVVSLYSGGLIVEPTVSGSYAADETVELKLNKGFAFAHSTVFVNDTEVDADFDDDVLTFQVPADVDAEDEMKITGLRIEATTADEGDIATISVKVGSLDKVSVEVAKVVDYTVAMTVDEDEDIPVMYSGTDADNTGLTDDSDHWSLEVTVEESFPGAWSMRQGFTMTLPEGVYVTDVDVIDAENFERNGSDAGVSEWEEAFEDAYQDGDHLNFEFDKRIFDDVNVSLAEDPASLTFKLQLVADPGFSGDVELGLEGALLDTQSVVIAKFVEPYTVEASQNDLKIDSRYTEIPTDIIVTEAADGLWDDGAEFTFNIENDLISFEDDATFTTDEESEMELKTSQSGGTLAFEVKSGSDSAATVTISDMELFMDRNIPTGPYALEMTTSMSDAFEAQLLYAYDDTDAATADYGDKLDGDNFVGDVTEYSNVVKDTFVNVITGTTDGAMFTTKVVVPVGENYLISGETRVELDVPAYINGDGYTMLPVRAVSVALGIDNNSVLWDQASKTVTILYGQRIISMINGQKVMYINGQAVATSSAVEITNDRAFLPMRDLATALGVTDITWDETTRTATLNGNQ